MSMKQNKLIPTYPMSELLGKKQDLIVMVGDDDEGFSQVRLSDKEFFDVVKIINKTKLGFGVNCYDEVYEIVEKIDFEND